MKLSRKWTTVTPLSKLIALILFISLPFVGFYIGYKINKLPIPKVAVTPAAITRTSDTTEDILKRCGDLPYTSFPNISDVAAVVSQHAWAPDCRHIAWSVEPRPLEGVNPPKNSGSYGLFLYDDRTKQTRKVLSFDQSPAFESWKDSITLVFTGTVDGKTNRFDYDINTGKSVASD